MAIVKRGNTWHLRRRVPKRYQKLDPRQTIYMSLHTDSELAASQKEPIVWQEQVNSWEARLAGETDDADRRLDAAHNLAKVLGVRYLTAPKVAKLPREELLQRIEMVQQKNGKVDHTIAVATLGGASDPGLKISAALKAFWGLAKDRTFGKSADQVRRWENPRKKAIANLIGVIGDKQIQQISAEDMLDFRDWLLKCVGSGEVKASSANKDLTHLGDVLKTVVKMKKLNVALPLADLKLKEAEKVQRIAFSDAWIKTRLLAHDALNGLNLEARCIMLAMINTGARPSEIAGMRPEEIRLDAEVPHLAISPIGRQLKTANARRLIPLLGVSLEAVRQFPQGFPSYRDGSATLSATVNKFLTENGLLETKAHSLYGLRHNFEDRMLATGIDERIRRDVMGHALKRERYGLGATLEHVQRLLTPIAF